MLLHKIIVFILLSSFFYGYDFSDYNITADNYCSVGEVLVELGQKEEKILGSTASCSSTYPNKLGKIYDTYLQGSSKYVKIYTKFIDISSGGCDGYITTFLFECIDTPSCPPNSHYSSNAEECVCDTGYYKDSNNTCIKPKCPPTYLDENTSLNYPLVAQNVDDTECLSIVANNTSTSSLIFNVSHPQYTDYKCCYGFICSQGENWDINLSKCIPDCPAGQRYDEQLNNCISICADNEIWNSELGKCVNNTALVDNNNTDNNNSNSNTGDTTGDNDSSNSSSNDNTNNNKENNNTISGVENLISNLNKQIDILEKQNNILKDINSSLNPDLTNNEELKQLNNGLIGIKNAYSNVFNSFNESKNDFFDFINGKDVPTINLSASQNDCKFCFFIFGGKACIDFNSFSIIRPFFRLILNLMLLYFTIRLYVLIARDIVGYFLGGS